MTSKRTPYIKLGFTREAVTVDFKVGRTAHKIDVPKGTRCCLLQGPNERWVVDDLSFLDTKNGSYTDADNYGIPINSDNVEAETPTP